jgi:hypothetical protein
MANLIPESQRGYLKSIIDDIHDTFARDIVVYKDAKRVVISTDPNYNYLYNNVSGEFGTSVENQPQSQTFKARILYEDKQREKNFDGEANSQINVERPIGQVRLKINETGYLYLKNVKRVELDGRKFIIDGDERPHGLFGAEYYTFYLRPIE